VKPGDSRGLLNEIRSLIEAARRQTAAAVNVGLTALYWQIGNRILREVLGNERATYGEQIVATVSRQLVSEFGRGFEEKNLRRMMQFAEAFPDETIVATLWRQLSWSHFRELLPLLSHISASSTPRCVVSRGGASPHFMSVLNPCCMSAPRSPSSPTSS